MIRKAATRVSRLIFPLILLSACGGESPTEDVTSSVRPVGDGPRGYYAGAFPCDGCPGIDVGLLLHDDGYFFLRQHYRAGSASKMSTATVIGRWMWFADDGLLVLQARGPERRFRVPEPDIIEMFYGSDEDYRLARTARPADFPGSLPLTGMLEPQGNAMIFSECLAGLVTPVKASDFEPYRRQMRRAGNPEGAIYAEFDGEYAWSEDGDPQSVTIRQFGTVRPGQTC